MFKKFFSFFGRHKIFTVFLVIVLVGIGYFAYSKASAGKTETRYLTDVVTRGTIVTSVSGTGEISASNSVDVKAKVSADATNVAVTEGQSVKTGDLLVQLDTKDAQKAIRDAQINLESAKLSLQKSQEGALPTDLASAQLNVDNAQNNLATAKTKADLDLANLYSDTKGILQDIYNKMDDALNNQIDGIYNGLNTNNPKLSFLTANSQAENNATNQLLLAKSSLADLKTIVDNFPTDQAAIDKTIDKFISASVVDQSFASYLSDAVNSAITSNGVPQATLDGYKNTVSSLRSSANANLTSLNNQKQSIANQKFSNVNNINSAQNSVTTAENNLASIQSGTNPLDLKSQELSVQQKQNSLSDAESALADYTVRAPFDGIVTNLTVKKGDSVSGSTAIATLITKQQVAIISLNEVDISKVSLGQKVNLTFDALPDLSLTGQVIDIDAIGTVSQGVVTYNVKIGFDSPDNSIKPGMSVSASIITNVKQDILIVPNSAIKTQGTANYVQIFNPALPEDTTGLGIVSIVAPTSKTVVIGVADDTNTEIVSGLNEGDQVVTKTTTATAAKATTAAPSLLQGLTGGSRGAAGATGAVRAGGGSAGFRAN
jgi:HlyD family secretion protein